MEPAFQTRGEGEGYSGPKEQHELRRDTGNYDAFGNFMSMWVDCRMCIADRRLGEEAER